MMRTLLLALCCCAGSLRGEAVQYVGTTPAGEPVRQMLGIGTAAEVIEWRLTLRPLGRYELVCSYGKAGAGSPGLGPDVRRIERTGAFTLDGDVYRLAGAGVSLRPVSPYLLHILNADGTLMAGDSGWSYTLNRADRAEAPVDLALTLSEQGVSRQMTPLAAAGPGVFAVFEGRTPCQGIAGVLRVAATPGCMKVKWRITLYQDPATHAPTTYKVEGTLHRAGERTGTWTVEEGALYRLREIEPGTSMDLRKGDDNVLFVLNRAGQPMVGTTHFSYTLNRRRCEKSGGRSALFLLQEE